MRLFEVSDCFPLQNDSKNLAKSPNKGMAFAEALVGELSLAGIEHACISPGSRSALLAIAAKSVPSLNCWIHIDERAGSFFGLGLAKATKKPVVLICTSGTAAANFMPAVVEAHYSNAPLVVLTADRPPEHKDWGAGQTIDQTRLYGTHVRWFVEAATPESRGEMLRYARQLAARAAASAFGPPAGPVHLNLPFREPLDLTLVDDELLRGLEKDDPTAALGRGGRPFLSVRKESAHLRREDVGRLADIIVTHPKGVISCGPYLPGDSLPRSAVRLAGISGWPILADGASQLRFCPDNKGAPVISGSDLFLRSAKLARRFRPEVVLRFGASPTSKSFRLWLEGHSDAQVIVIDPNEQWNDPSHLAAELLQCDPVHLCEEVALEIERRGRVRKQSEWLGDWREADVLAKRTIAEELARPGDLTEPRIVREIVRLSPEGAALFVSSGMPIRILDGYAGECPKQLDIFCNRGANGIDGIVSTALGVTAGRARRSDHSSSAILLTGDLAFLHDINGLMAAGRHDLKLTIVVLNNDGGGIFSFLKVADFGQMAHFNTLFTVPHGMRFDRAAALYGLHHRRVTTLAEFEESFVASLSWPRTTIIEVPVSQEINLREVKRVASEVASTAASGLAEELHG
jgi:2-succinyl-5-enolpyruvyl-6-hydroxy-3-cyclohexene-1-carboxylate synthase